MRATLLQRERGLAILTGESDILTVARETSELIRNGHMDAAVIGGIAVVLHGHVRTTLDVDVYAADPHALDTQLRQHGFAFDPARKEYLKDGVPVHLVTLAQITQPPLVVEDIENIRTVSLPDLLTMKLRTGTTDVLRAQDLADVIGLIRCNHLGGDFASRIAKPFREEFRKLVHAVDAGQQ